MDIEYNQIHDAPERKFLEESLSNKKRTLSVFEAADS